MALSMFKLTIILASLSSSNDHLNGVSLADVDDPLIVVFV